MTKKVNKMEHKVSRALQLNSILVLFLPTKLETIFTLLQIVQEEETTIYISCIECIQSDWATSLTSQKQQVILVAYQYQWSKKSARTRNWQGEFFFDDGFVARVRCGIEFYPGKWEQHWTVVFLLSCIFKLPKEADMEHKQQLLFSMCTCDKKKNVPLK